MSITPDPSASTAGDPNPYRTPTADLLTIADTPVTESSDIFFVTSRKKMALLYVFTLGSYCIYWFYKHWKIQKSQSGEDYWPIPRAIFYVFFTHSLFRKIAEGRWNTTYTDWRHRGLATLFVVLTIISNILDRISMRHDEIGLTDVVSYAIMFICLYPLWVAQGHANEAAGDPEGKSNSRISIYNIFFIIIGVALWAYFIMGLLRLIGLLPQT